MAHSNSLLSPYEILPIVQENKYLRKFFYFIIKWYVECTHLNRPGETIFMSTVNIHYAVEDRSLRASITVSQLRLLCVRLAITDHWDTCFYCEDFSCRGQWDEMPFTRRPVEFSLSIMEYGSVMVIIFLETTTWILSKNILSPQETICIK